MVDILRAEWQKMAGNKWTTGLLIWIFPVGAFGLVAGLSLMGLFSPNFRGNTRPILWTDAFMVSWEFVNNLFGRTFLLGFTAVIFAGEYQWGTWKNIVPRQRRSLLLLAKFINLCALILVAFGLMSLIYGFGYGIISRIADVPYGPEVTGEVMREFLGDYALQTTLSFVSILIASIYAALSAMFMQSILGGVMVGIVVSVAEPLVIPLNESFAHMFNTAFFLHLSRFSPYYSIANVHSWVRHDQAIGWTVASFQEFGLTAPLDSLSFSILVLFAWIVGGLGVVLYLFQRQDIVT